MKERKKRKWDGTCAPGRELKKRKGSHILGRPSLVGRLARTERELQRLRGERNNWVVSRRTERATQTVVPPPCTPQTEMCVRWYRGRWVLKRGAQRTDLGRGLLLAARDSLKGLECGMAASRGVCGRSLGPSKKRSSIVKWHMKGRGYHNSLFLHMPAPALVAPMPQPLPQGRPPLWAPAPQPLPQQALVPQPPPRGLLCPKCCLGGLLHPSRCLSRLQEQMPVGCPCP